MFVECKYLVYHILENSNKYWFDGWEQSDVKMRMHFQFKNSEYTLFLGLVSI